MTDEYFILCLVNTKTKESAGIEFCNDAEDLRFKRDMFLKDFGPDYVALTYPDSGQEMAKALLDAFPSTMKDQ